MDVIRKIKKVFSGNNPAGTDKRQAEFQKELETIFAHFSTDNLAGISPKSFEEYIAGEIGKIDVAAEGYKEYELDAQRDLSVKFAWGHNHDFKTFALKGRMGERHLYVTGRFMSFYPEITTESFKGKKVLDIGCWTGGTTLLLNALGAHVTAIEEVKRYAAMANYLVKSFGIGENVNIRPLSVYECNSEEFKEQFDLVFFPGVIYHLSDPVLALRILYNSLKVSGEILIESAGINLPGPVCRFDGFEKTSAGSKEEMNRSGWNYFLFSPECLERMMRQVGFDDIRTNWDHTRNRLYGYGKKKELKGISKAGLSVKDIL